MNCNIHNNVGTNFGDLERHIQDMYGFFANKYGFEEHPDIHLDSDEQNKAEILGKTAYYDPQSHEVHIYTDNRHPKDMLRSIAHELIHHKQNLEGRLQVGGYNGPGYYLKNDKLKDVEHEAMLEGNACMREWEDTKKYKNPKESKNMSLKEWKNNELNQLLLKKFGILSEGKKKPDADGDGVPDYADKKPGEDDHAEKKGDDDKKKKGSKPKKGEVPPQLQKHVKGKKEELDEADCLDEASCGDKDRLEEEEIEEGRMNPRTTNSDKFVGHEDRYQADRIHEVEELDPKSQYERIEMLRTKKNLTPEEQKELIDLMQSFQMMRETNNKLQESIRRIAKAKKVFLRGKRIK